MDAAAECEKTIDCLLKRLRHLERMGVRWVPAVKNEAACNASADVVFVAALASPEQKELVSRMIKAIGRSEADTPVIKVSEKAAAEAAAFSPRFIVAFGEAAAVVFKDKENSGEDGFFRAVGALLMATHSPAALLANRELKAETWAGLQAVMRKLEERPEKN